LNEVLGEVYKEIIKDQDEPLFNQDQDFYKEIESIR